MAKVNTVPCWRESFAAPYRLFSGEARLVSHCKYERGKERKKGLLKEPWIALGQGWAWTV